MLGNSIENVVLTSFRVFPDVPASGMYFLTYEVIKKKVAATQPKDKPISKPRELGGTILAGGMGKLIEATDATLSSSKSIHSWNRKLVDWNAARCTEKSTPDGARGDLSGRLERRFQNADEKRGTRCSIQRIRSRYVPCSASKRRVLLGARVLHDFLESICPESLRNYGC